MEHQQDNEADTVQLTGPAGIIPVSPVVNTTPTQTGDEVQFELGKEIESKIPYGASTNYRQLLAVAKASKVGTLDRWMKYQEVCQGTPYFSKLLQDIADIPAAALVESCTDILEKVLPPVDAVYAVDFPLPSVFRQYHSVYVDKINVDLSTIPPDDLRLFWWQPVKSPIFMAAVEELIKMVKRWPELMMDFQFCHLPAHISTTATPASDNPVQ